MSVNELFRRISSKLNSVEKQQLAKQLGIHVSANPFLLFEDNDFTRSQHLLKSLKLAVIDLSLETTKLKALIRVIFEFIDSQRISERTTAMTNQKNEKKQKSQTIQSGSESPSSAAPLSKPKTIAVPAQHVEIALTENHSPDSMELADSVGSQLLECAPPDNSNETQAKRRTRSEAKKEKQKQSLSQKSEVSFVDNVLQLDPLGDESFSNPKVLQEARERAQLLKAERQVFTLMGKAEKPHVDLYYLMKRGNPSALLNDWISRNSYHCPHSLGKCEDCVGVLISSEMKLNDGLLQLKVPLGKELVNVHDNAGSTVKQRLMRSLSGKMGPSLLSLQLFTTGHGGPEFDADSFLDAKRKFCHTVRLQ